ncbi:DUF4397 domain-containing protein [Chitinophaga agrisoli]|uniref:DUF4397 domain-containing protein n=1 Tax=Chitinophaga agrisoli TaxID=2607653 RepID=A0A5B2VU60_9BACT|nr:DUF4397 domain-containing protein [Chitinophaga agrisoli]KAA2241649.1 DUF4397 domain-containing protein [Chitinophaga agrisoli]
MKKWTQAALALLLLIAAIACNKNSDSDLPDTRGGITVYQMLPSYTVSLDFVLDTAIIGSNLGYGQSSGPYKYFRAQNYKLLIYPAGVRDDTLLTTELSVRNGHNISVFLYADSTNLVRLRTTDDDLTPPSTETPRSKIRVVDLADVSVLVDGSKNLQPLAMDVFVDYIDEKSIPVFRSVSFGAITPSLEILAQDKDLDFNWRDSSKVLQTARLNAQEGKIYTLVTTIGKGKPITDTSFRLWQFINN